MLLTVHLIDQTRESIEVESEELDVIPDLNRRGGLLTKDAWYPLHAIVKIKFGGDGNISSFEEDWQRHQQAVAGYEARKRAKRKRGGEKR